MTTAPKNLSDLPVAGPRTPLAPGLGKAPGRGFVLRALDATPTYWFSMFAASALGTNLGDFCVDWLALGRGMSFAALACISGLAIWSDSRFRRGEVGFWVAIVTLRAAATNVGDFLTHDLALSYLVLVVILAVATLVAGHFTHPGAGKSGTPRIDHRYWIAMLIAGVFGTIGGDLTAHTIGLYSAAGVLCALLVVVVALRGSLAPASLVAYWFIVLVERCAGTPVGDSLAEHRGLHLGLPLAMACTGGLFLAGLLVRGRPGRALLQQA